MITVRIFIFYCLSLILLYGCDGSPFKPPESPERSERPEIIFLEYSIDTVNRGLIVNWQGNKNTHHIKYSTNSGLESNDIENSSITIPHLAEGSHLFTITPFDVGNNPGISRDTLFVIDVVKGPGIVFSSRSVSADSNVNLILEDTNGFMAAHIELIAENSCVDFTDTTQTKRDNDGYLFMIDTTSKTNRIILDILISGTTGSSSGKNIGTIHLKPKANGKVTIDSATIKIIDIYNKQISLDTSNLDWINVTK